MIAGSPTSQASPSPAFWAGPGGGGQGAGPGVLGQGFLKPVRAGLRFRIEIIKRIQWVGVKNGTGENSGELP